MMQEQSTIQREIAQIAAWWSSGASLYRTIEKRHADACMVSSVNGEQAAAS